MSSRVRTLSATLHQILWKVIGDIKPHQSFNSSKDIVINPSAPLKQLHPQVFNITTPMTITFDGAFSSQHGAGIGIGIFDGVGRIIGAFCNRNSNVKTDKIDGAAIEAAIMIVKDIDPTLIKFRGDSEGQCLKLTKANFNYEIEYLPRELNQVADKLATFGSVFGFFDSKLKKTIPLAVQEHAKSVAESHYAVKWKTGHIVDTVDVRISQSDSSEYYDLFELIRIASTAIINDSKGRKEINVILMDDFDYPILHLKGAIYGVNAATDSDFLKKQNLHNGDDMFVRLHSFNKLCRPLGDKFKAKMFLNLSKETFIPGFSRVLNIPVCLPEPSIRMDLGKVVVDERYGLNFEMSVLASD